MVGSDCQNHRPSQNLKFVLSFGQFHYITSKSENKEKQFAFFRQEVTLLNSNLSNLLDGTCEILDLTNIGNSIPLKLPMILSSNCTYKVIYGNSIGDNYDGETTKQYAITETNNCIILGIGYSYNNNSVNPEITSDKGILTQAFDSGLYNIGSDGDFYRTKGYKATNIKGATLTFSDANSTKEYVWLIVYEN